MTPSAAKGKTMRFIPALALALLISGTAYANPGAPSDLPEPLQPLAAKGAQLRYLGTENGMDGWIAIYQGQEQYYYITPDKKAFVTGLMYGNDGRSVTIDQVRQLQSKSGGVLDLLAESAPGTATATAPPLTSVTDKMKVQSPSERMFADIEKSNWLTMGANGAPVIYSFIDPQCPHCHDFLKSLKKDYIDQGLVQVRLIPVGFQPGSLSQAAILLAAPNGAELFQRYLDGDKDALPAKNDISTQAVQQNMALMQSWKFNVTPLTVYRGRDGKVKILRGKAKDIRNLIGDLPTATAKPGN